MNTQIRSARMDLALALGAAALAAGACLLGGCVRYSHTTLTGERTSFTGFLIRGEASKISTDTTSTGTNYTRKVSLGSLKGETEMDKMNGLAESIARGVASGANPAKK